jgi:carbonic anhydrase
MFFPKKYGDPVIRNVGGRVTPATLQTMGMLGEIAQREGGLRWAFIWSFFTTPTAGLLTSKGNPTRLSSYFGIGQEDLPAKAVTDPHAAVAVDVATRKRDPCPACELAGVWTRL